jgi:acetolactate synthase I/II/III large subunit
VTRRVSGADVLCATLEAAGVECVFGLPAAQTLQLYEALRRSAIRAIVPTHELAAAFMAGGYARASGKVGVLTTMAGPGFMYALAGIAEAKLDGTPLVHITLQPARGENGEPGFQAVDQRAIARPLVKATYAIEQWDAIPSVVTEALHVARSANPGPVLVEIAATALDASGRRNAPVELEQAEPSQDSIEEVAALVAAARRPAIFVTGECFGATALLQEVAVRGRVPVCVPVPTRGILPEDHAWCLCFDEQRTALHALNTALQQFDLVVLLGANLGHASTAGAQLVLGQDRLVQVSTAGSSLGNGYGARMSVRAEPAAVLKRLAHAADAFASEWTAGDMDAFRARFADHQPRDPPEPLVGDVWPADFFSALRSALPRDAIVVTDAGLHQVLVRKHHLAFSPGGLMIPSDFQSMGFGLPAAIGAKLGAPDRAVLVVTGDGGFNISGLEMLTAVKERVPVIVVVFNDGELNLIRLEQFRRSGRSHAVGVLSPDFARLAASLGINYRRVAGDAAEAMRAAVASGESMLIDVPVSDSIMIHGMHARGAVGEAAARALGPELVGWLKRRLR